MNDPTTEGARLAFDAALTRLRRSVHPLGVEDGREGDEQHDYIKLRDRVAEHAGRIMEAVAEFDRYRDYYRRVGKDKP